MKKLTKALSFLLTLAMVVGLMPGVSLTAYADDDPPYAQYKNTTTVITFDGISWYLIDYDASTVTLLAKECVASSKYDKSAKFVEYSSSPTVKTAVDNWYTDNITADAKAAVSGNAMFLLTKGEANAITDAEVRKCTNAPNGGWWLCSQGKDKYMAAFVDGGSGAVNDNGKDTEDSLGVRPALQLDLSKVMFDADTKTFALAATSPAHTHDGITFTAWTSTTSLPTEAGSYYLTQDVTISSTWNVTGETNLCLNGHGIRYSGSGNANVITVGSGNTLNLYDCDTTTKHYITLTDGRGTEVSNTSTEGAVEVIGGYITGGNNTNSGMGGGGVCNRGTFNMSGGTIACNKAYAGGGVCNYNTFNMSGGSIADNTATYTGGGVINYEGTFTLSGGRITGNYASSYGGGVFHCVNHTFRVSGAPQISGNTVGQSKTSNVHTQESKGVVAKITIGGGGLVDGASIGVTMYNPGVFTTGSTDSLKASDYIDNFTSDNGAYEVQADGNELKLAALPPHTHDDITFTPWTSADSLPTEAGSYYLTQDVTISSTWNVTGTTNLCLNGHGIRYGGNGEAQVITVDSGATLNLYDCNTTVPHYITLTDGRGTAVSDTSVDGAIKVTGGYITGGKGEKGGVYVGGTLNMYGGTIVGNMTKQAYYGGGVSVDDGGRFTMSGGSITGNTAAYGGGVRIAGDGTFTMSGGAITGNTASFGGGVFIYGTGTFEMSGGSITNNTATRYSGGVLKNGNATFKLSGSPTITGNKMGDSANNVDVGGGTITLTGALESTASIGVTRNSPGVFTNSTGDAKAKDYASNFTSDNAAYSVEADGNELKLAQEPVPYMAWDETGKTVKNVEGGCTDYTVVTSSTISFEDGKWYVVKDNVEIANRIAVTGTVHLILCDGATLTASKGITVTDGNALNIYAQSEGENMGKLVADASSADNYAAGIGGFSVYNSGSGKYDTTCGKAGTVNIHGGTVTATGKSNSAGIGGGNKAAGGTVTVYSGTITATGGNYAAGIGGGMDAAGGMVTILGGIVKTQGGANKSYPGAGIGAGNGSSNHSDLIVAATHIAYSNKSAITGENKSEVADKVQGTGSAITIARKQFMLVEPGTLHTHDFTYSVSGATITATCTADGCDLPESSAGAGDHVATLTIVAPTLTTYGGTGNAAATLTGLDDFNTATGKTIAATDIEYVGRDGTSYDKSTTAPTNAGKYTAKITVEEKTASVDYEIEKVNQSVTAPTAKTDLTYNGESLSLLESQCLISTGNYEGVKYKIGENGEWSSNTPSAVNAGTYTVFYKVDGNENYNEYPESSIEVTIARAQQEVNAPEGKSDLVYKDYSQQLLKNPAMVVKGNTIGLIEYRVNDDGTWSLMLPSAENAGTYTVYYRVPGNNNYEAYESNITVSLAKADPEEPTGLAAIYGQTLANVTLPEGWTWDSSATSVGNVGDKTFPANYTPTDAANYNAKSNVNLTVTVSKADPVANAPTATATYGQTLANVTLTNPDGNTPGTWAWVDSTQSVGNVVSPAATFKANFTPDDTTNYSAVTNVDVTVTVNKANQTAPVAPTSASVSVNSITLTAIDNGEYSKDGENWQESPTFTELTMNTEYTFYQRLKEDNNHNASPASAASTISTNNHVHEWSYEANGATITATCANTDGGHGEPKTEILTILAPTGTLVYDGTTSYAASFANSKTAVGGISALPIVQYQKKDGDNWGTATTEAPKDAGTYRASITLTGVKTAASDSADITASVEYTIAKADVGTPTVTMAGYNYGGTVSTPGIGAYSGEGAVTYYYNTADSTTGGTEWKDITSTTLAAGTYYMYAVIAETGNYSGYTTATTSFTVAAPYSLYLGGTQVTSANAADVFGDGKASYNAESNTLTLKGYSNSEKFYKEAEAGVYEAEYRIAAGVYYAGAEKLTVALEGNNVLTMPEFSEDKLDNAAFFSKGSVEFTGTGSLTATGGAASDSSEDSNVGSYGLCAVGENAAFMGSGAVTFTAGSGESSYGAYFGKETAVAFSGGTVTMTGGTSTGGSYGMYCGRVEVTGGEVQVTGGEAGIFSFGIYCWRNISVTGGTLTATGGSAANSSYGIRGIRETRCDIVVSGGTLNAVGGSASKESCGIYSDWGGVNVSGGGAVTAEGGTVTGDSGRSCGISNSMHSISVKNGTLTATGGSVTGSGGKSIGLYSSVGPIYFEEGASVSCLGGTVTSENGESFGVSGFGSYIMGGVIAATGGNAAYSCGYYDKMAMLVDAGTFTATGGEGSRSHGIFNRDYIEVNGGAVTAVGDSGSAESCGVYLAARQLSDETYRASTLTITGGEVSATGGSCGVFCDPATDGKAIVITGGTATAQGNVAISKPPILGADVSASASTELGGTPAEYNEEENNNYKFFTTVTAPGSKTPITAVSFTVEEPVVGAEPAEWVEITTEPEGALTTTAYRAVWVEVDEDYNYVPMTSSLFEAGKKYAVLEPNEESAGAPLVALCASGYILPTDEEPVYTINGEETLLLGYFGPYTPIEGAEFSVSVSPAELRFSAYTGYSEEEPSLYREITASNTGNGKVRFITAGFTESSMYEQFGLIVGGMTATVYPKEGLTQGTYTATVRIGDLYDRFDTIEVPVTFTVYAATSSSAATTVTVPVSGEDETVNVTVSVSGDTATITGADVDKVLNAEEVGTVTVDVSTLKNGVTEVVIPGAMVEKIADAVADESSTADGLEIKLPTGTVTFDAEAVAAISEQADGKDLHLNLEDIGENKLSAAQKDTVKDMDVQGVLDAYMTSNGKRISDFKGGKATVTVSYELKDGQVGRGIVVWYVADNGEKTEVPAAYSNKEISFTVEHFSNYVIAYDAERAASCPKDDTCPISEFTDADANAWYHDGVHFVLENKLMSGYGNGKFSPADYTSRAMVAQILWNLEGKPASTYEMNYSDVASGAWYADAIRWATEKGIVTGYGDGKFGPDDNITREQLAAIIYRYAQSKGQGFTGAWMFNLDYEDASSVSDWASEAMHWMVMKGIIKGQTDKTLAPKSNASRAEIATMIMRYATLEK